jgi:LuxR family quorum-sensing system transcriptional regulator CciR
MDYGEIQAFIQASRDVRSESELRDLMLCVTRDLGFQHFALAHHSNAKPDEVVRLTNYPDDWKEYYTKTGQFIADPIHCSSKTKAGAFEWTEVDSLIDLTQDQAELLKRGAEVGLSNGYTIPIHIPGDATGSCTFVVDREHEIRRNSLPVAHLIGGYAFEAARRYVRRHQPGQRPRMSDRQRDCVILVAKGKTDWEISRILGISEETVTKHVKRAMELFDVAKRTQLLVSVLYDGQITFDDIVHRQ